MALVALGLGGRAALAQAAKQPERKLEAIEKAIEETRDRGKELTEKAAALAREIEDLQKEAVASARTAQDTEEELSGLEGRLRDLKAREKVLHGELGAREDQMAVVLAGLQRMALRPPEAMLALPMPTHDVVRSAILLRAVVPTLNDRAADLRGELHTLAAVRTDIAAQKAEIARAAKRLDRQKGELATLLRRKADLRRSTEAELRKAEQRATTLARDAENLRDLLVKLEEERKRREAEAQRLAALAVAKPKPPPVPTAAGARPPPAKATEAAAPAAAAAGRPLDQVRGAMPMPARGTLVTRYGESDAAGTTSRGIVIATRPAAQVIAPSDGVVAFAGAFRGYGQLLIIEHGGGYHTLLSGMSRIDAVVGQRLLAGEPVGGMAPEGSPTLYVEIRRDGQPVNPLPWLSARKG
ncbi:murein hydrolase activator EnvC family protein [Novispirillum sp. DQ9]|uniref:murein hydrolase activator EnvC family protein n=1 Tax=Novispirillum sp. DQ9 TaxID=3398612 RepID=UPI003C7DB43C